MASIRDDTLLMQPQSPAPILQPVSASLPAETRIYAVGDIHGRADLLADIIARIDDDLQRRPIRYATEVYLGDYIDRGPDSSSVLDMLAVRMVRNDAICLRGNHEAMLEAFLRDPATLPDWLPLGARQTLASYGIASVTAEQSAVTVHHHFTSNFPPAHQVFLQCLRNSFCCGDFFFVHAGIRPSVPIERQQERDMLWIRKEFLNATQDHGKYIVHGHTPVPHADIRSNRVNIDTGAWRSGVLTCVAIEGDTLLIL
ncbi:MAG: metallophosphoesterase family protein [Tardiphaga sp.]